MNLRVLSAVHLSAVVSLRWPYPALTSNITIFQGGTVEDSEDSTPKKAVDDSGYNG